MTCCSPPARDLAELVLRSGGDVLVIPGQQMPAGAGESGVAAVLRYAA